MNLLMIALLIGLQLFAFVSMKEVKVKRDDLQSLTGNLWSGTLTYLDYRSKKKISIPANLTVKANGDDRWSWIFEYKYPEEPKANGDKIVTLSKDGKSINDEAVVERTRTPDGTVTFVTEKKGDDNDRPAVFRFTYSLNASKFSIRKEVRYQDENQFFERNEYSWQR